MKYKIAICDDSDADRQYVLNMVNTWAAQTGHAVHTDTFSSAENFLFRYSEESDYDILLLDIEMEAMDGVTMAKQLRKSNDTVQIVFITGYADYMRVLLFNRALTPNWWLMSPANTMSFGTHRHSIMRSLYDIADSLADSARDKWIVHRVQMDSVNIAYEQVDDLA